MEPFEIWCNLYYISSVNHITEKETDALCFNSLWHYTVNVLKSETVSVVLSGFRQVLYKLQLWVCFGYKHQERLQAMTGK